MLLIEQNINTDHRASPGQDILAVSIIGRSLVHHSLMQRQRAIRRHFSGLSNILSGPDPLNTLLALAFSQIGFSGQLVRKRICRRHRQIVLPRATRKGRIPLQRRKVVGSP